jgi:glycosyltransferase involved in cell wall biosynthesis
MEKILEKVKYSFVLPAYKAKYLKESIDSIINQTYADCELIIVNDASPEDVDSIVTSYSDERIQYYRNEKNIGGTDLVAPWNYCISYA